MSTCQLAMLPCDIVGDNAGIVSSCGQQQPSQIGFETLPLTGSNQRVAAKPSVLCRPALTMDVRQTRLHATPCAEVVRRMHG